MATRGLSLSVSGLEAAPPRCRPPVSAMFLDLKMEQEGTGFWLSGVLILIFFKQDTIIIFGGEVLDAYLMWMTLVSVTGWTRLDVEVTLCLVVAEYAD